MYCEPVPEILEALKMPPGSAMLLTRAAYGLVEAPLQWYLTIAGFLESLGAERQFSDPCCWTFFREDRTPVAFACGQVEASSSQAGQHQKLVIHALPKESSPVIATWADAAHANRIDGSSTKGVLIGWSTHRLLEGELEKVTPLFWQSARTHRTCSSSAAAETCAAVDGEDEMYAIRFQAFEFLGGCISVWKCDDAVKKVTGVLITDSKNLYDRVNQTMLTLKGAEKRSDIETLCLKESMNSTDTMVKWVNGDSQLANSLTKESEPQQLQEYLRRMCRWRIVYDPSLLLGRKRRQMGISSLEKTQAESAGGP